MKSSRTIILITVLLASVFLGDVEPTYAVVHLWDINEVFSNAGGDIQFIEMINPTGANGEGKLAGNTFTTTLKTFPFLNDLVGQTGFKKFLMATPGFAAVSGNPTPDYIIPANFFDNINGDTLDFAGFDVFTFAAGELPDNGTDSLNRDLTTGPASPTNFAAPPFPPSLPDPLPDIVKSTTVPINLETVTVASGLGSVVELTHAGDGSGRLFVVEQRGLIHIIQGGVLLPTPFLDVSPGGLDLLVPMPFFCFNPTMPTPATCFDERGLLGLAFHPDFADLAAPGFRKIYTYTSEPVGAAADFTVPLPSGTFDHQAVIAEWTVSAGDANIIDTGSRRELMRIDEPQFNHDGGKVAFGPDGYLYISLGDGGAGNDDAPGHGDTGNGQNKKNVLGTVLRIDPIDPTETSGPTRDKVSANGQYRLPKTNPFSGGGDKNGVDEIYAFGFRNPYRFSFDSLTGDLILADVGQGNIEEIDIVTSGGNYGWNLKEGSFRFDPFTGNVSDDLKGLPKKLIDPVAEYDHGDGITVIGGFVYRGSAIPALAGKYVFGDFSRTFFPGDGRLFFADLATGEILEFSQIKLDGFVLTDLDLYIKSFGQDEAGEVYLLADAELGPLGTMSEVLKIIP